MNPSDGKNEGLALLVKPLIAIIILGCLSVGAFLAVSQHYINALFEDVEKKYRQDLINIVSVARHAVEPALIRVRTGEISREEAIRQIRELVRTMTYEDQDGKNYVFMSSYNGIMMVQPFEPAKELTNQWDLRDANGLYIIRELVKAAKTHPRGSFVRYDYHLPGVHTMQEKLAYVVGLPEVECYIGTGMYMEQSIREQRAILTKVRYASLWLFLAVLLPITVSVIVILRRNRRLLAEIKFRRQAEENVKINEAKYRSIFENAGKGIFQTAEDGRLLSANPAFARICGYDSAQQMIDAAVSTTQHYADPAERTQLLELMSKNKYVDNFEVRMRRRDGALIWVAISSRIVRDDGGNFLCYEGTIEDIHARKQAEQEVKASRKLLTDILQAASNFAIIATDPQGVITAFNRGAELMLGYTADEMQGRKTPLAFHVESEVLARSVELTEAMGHPVNGFHVFTAVPEHEGSETREWTYVRKDGTSICVSLVSTAIRSDRGEILGYLGIATDITERKRTEEKLGDSLLKLDNAQEVAKIGFWSLDLSVMKVEWSRGLKQIFELSPDGPTPTYDEFWTYVHPDDKNFVEIQIEKQLKAKKESIIKYNYRIVTKAGVVKYLDHSGRQTMNPEGRLTGLYGSIQDVTELKQTERALLEREERLKGINRNMPGAVFQLYRKDNGEYGLSYVSERMAEFIGSPIDATATFPAFLSFIYEEDRNRLIKSIQEAMETGAPWNFEGRFIKSSDKVMWFHGLATPTRQEQRLALNGILLDITERKQAEEKFTKIFMTAPDCIVISRMSDGMLLDVNMGFEEITSWKRDEVLGKTSLEINFWVDIEDRASMVNEIRAGKDVLRREFQFRRKDGTARMGIYSVRPIEIAGDQWLVFILNDITDRKLLEEEHRKLEQQLSQSQKLDAIGQLASGVAHDFNNILMGIQGNATLMQMEYHPEHPHYQKLSRIEEHVKRGANLTRQLLGFAREGKYEVRTLSLNDLIRKVAQFFLETHKEIEADFQLQNDLYPIEADAGQIEQVLLNMFINAGHAMPKGGHLHIRTDNAALQEMDTAAFQLKPGDFVKVSISDTGIGMDAETLKRIFEPFFTTRLKEGGSGLGLASAYGIIRNHGGAIKVYSEPGAGSTFKIYLPSSRKKANTEEPVRHERLVSGSGVILLVDDEPMILGAASEMLKLLGYTVYPAASGQEAAAVYTEKKDKINLVILDMIMPGMSGAQVLELLKEVNPEIKVILSSGYSMQGEVKKVMETGCCGFIQKPYSFKELSQTVHSVLYPDDV